MHLYSRLCIYMYLYDTLTSDEIRRVFSLYLLVEEDSCNR